MEDVSDLKPMDQLEHVHRVLRWVLTHSSDSPGSFGTQVEELAKSLGVIIDPYPHPRFWRDEEMVLSYRSIRPKERRNEE